MVLLHLARIPVGELDEHGAAHRARLLAHERRDLRTLVGPRLALVLQGHDIAVHLRGDVVRRGGAGSGRALVLSGDGFLNGRGLRILLGSCLLVGDARCGRRANGKGEGGLLVGALDGTRHRVRTRFQRIKGITR